MTDLDEQMCLESLIAGIIELSKELDELESNKDKITSDANGVKQLDKQKLLESVMAGIAALQKELDEVE